MLENGVLSSLPHMLFVATTCSAGYVADKMRKKGKLSITTIRKIFNSVAFFGSGLFILLVIFVGCRPVAAIIFLCLSLGFVGANAAAFRVTHVDMSPQFAGVLSGIIGTIGCCTGFLVPYTAGKLTANEETLFNWGRVFGTTAGIAFGSGLVYDVFSSSELQAWNPPLEDMVPKENAELQNNVEGRKLSPIDRTIS